MSAIYIRQHEYFLTILTSVFVFFSLHFTVSTIYIRQHENQRSKEYLFLNNFDFYIWLFLIALVSSVGFQICSRINRLPDGEKKLLSHYLRKMQGVTNHAVVLVIPIPTRQLFLWYAGAVLLAGLAHHNSPSSLSSLPLGKLRK